MEARIENMGMTNEQFELYNRMLLRNLQRALAEFQGENPKTKTLEQVIEDLEASLKKP